VPDSKLAQISGFAGLLMPNPVPVIVRDSPSVTNPENPVIAGAATATDAKIAGARTTTKIPSAPILTRDAFMTSLPRQDEPRRPRSGLV
jgi:hypothetical protein